MEQVVFGFVPKVAVVAIGGNALLPADSDGTQAEQETLARETARRLVDVVEKDYELVVVHGNGPQVGNLLIQVEQSVLQIPPQSLDVAVAQTQGSVGFLLQSALRNELLARGIARDVVTLLTEVEVDPDDPAFARPTKPVGPFVSRFRARILGKERGWTLVEDAGRGFRKVVPSPRPRRILNFDVVRRLLTGSTVVIAAGGGGIPVVPTSEGGTRGVEAVVDKDDAAALLAAQLKADLFVVLTGVPRVMRNFGKRNAAPLLRLTSGEARRLRKQGHFPPGSMGPKIDAALRFLDAGGKCVLVTDAVHLKDALAGRDGTTIVAGGPSGPTRRGKKRKGLRTR
jgi:carbamate kinase